MSKIFFEARSHLPCAGKCHTLLTPHRWFLSHAGKNTFRTNPKDLFKAFPVAILPNLNSPSFLASYTHPDFLCFIIFTLWSIPLKSTHSIFELFFLFILMTIAHLFLFFIRVIWETLWHSCTFYLSKSYSPSPFNCSGATYPHPASPYVPPYGTTADRERRAHCASSYPICSATEDR